MTRSLHSDSFLLVEGYDDKKVYGRFIDESTCRLIVANGKPNLLEVIDILDKDNVEGVLGIVDNDFWEVDNISPPSENTVSTDAHDIETMILMSCALDSIKREHISQDKLSNLGTNLLDSLIECSIPIGYLRWISSEKQDNLGLKFEGVKYKRFIDTKKLIIDIEQMITTVKNHSQKHHINEKDLKERIVKLLKSKSHDPCNICHGEDMVQILSLGLQNAFGNSSSDKLTPEILHSALRISFSIDSFKSTELYKSIMSWENNTGYEIL